MSDSSKLQYVYGILTLIGAFICFAGVVSTITIWICLSLSDDALSTSILLFPFFVVFFLLSIKYSIEYFIKVGKISQKEKDSFFN